MALVCCFGMAFGLVWFGLIVLARWCGSGSVARLLSGLVVWLWFVVARYCSGFLRFGMLTPMVWIDCCGSVVWLWFGGSVARWLGGVALVRCGSLWLWCLALRHVNSNGLDCLLWLGGVVLVRWLGCSVAWWCGSGSVWLAMTLVCRLVVWITFFASA